MGEAGQEELIRAATAGDRAAFDALLGPLIESGYRLAVGMLLDRAAAEDAVQEAALKAWRKLGNLRQGADLRPWFLAIVANQCRSTARQSWWSVVKGGPAVPAVGRSEDQVVRTLDLERGLKRLGHHDRAILVLHYYFDLPLEQAAAILKISPPAAKSRLYRAVRRLRPHLETWEART